MLEHGVFDDGIHLLPNQAGIYGILNRCNGRRWVGLAGTSIRARALAHRRFFRSPSGPEVPILRDLRLHGPNAFIFLVLELRPDDKDSNHRAVLKARELWWAQQLLTLDERTGYNLEAGGLRSPASRFREQERKLMRSNSGRYELLPGVDPSNPINSGLLESWQRAEEARPKRP
jgi:hypothetical protein